jgi:hypothetical protein
MKIGFRLPSLLLSSRRKKRAYRIAQNITSTPTIHLLKLKNMYSPGSIRTEPHLHSHQHTTTHLHAIHTSTYLLATHTPQTSTAPIHLLPPTPPIRRLPPPPPYTDASQGYTTDVMCLSIQSFFSFKIFIYLSF